MSRLIWLHDEALSFLQPEDIQANDQLLYIWDNAYFDAKGWSLKRRVFLYECLLDLRYVDIQIYQGSTLQVLQQCLEQSPKVQLMSYKAREPELRALQKEVEEQVCAIDYLQAPSLFGALPRQAPKRFFRFWKAVEKQLLGERCNETRHRVR